MRSERIVRALGATGAAALAVGGMLALGVASASWRADGGGSGYARASTAAALSTLDASASTTAQLYPGGSGDVIVLLSNPNPFPLDVDSISGDGTITSDRGATCDASTGVSFSDGSGLGLVVPAEDTLEVNLDGAASMDGSSADACQGAIFTIPVAIG